MDWTSMVESQGSVDYLIPVWWLYEESGEKVETESGLNTTTPTLPYPYLSTHASLSFLYASIGE